MSGREHQMTKKRKHSKAEIAFKLAEADDLVTEGKLQSEIARTLGVSVMTLHRWRKLPSQSNGSSQIGQIAELPTRKFTAAAIRDRSAPRKDETRRRVAGRRAPDEVGLSMNLCASLD